MAHNNKSGVTKLHCLSRFVSNLSFLRSSLVAIGASLLFSFSVSASSDRLLAPYRAANSHLMGLPQDTSSLDVNAVAASGVATIYGSGELLYNSYVFGCIQCPTITVIGMESSPVYVLRPSNTLAGSSLLIESPLSPPAIEEFGRAVGMSGSLIAIGSPAQYTSLDTLDEDSNHVEPQLDGGGRVHLYQRSDETVTPRMIIAHGGLTDRFGAALDVDHVHLLAGRPGAIPGAADIFDHTTGVLVDTVISPGMSDGYASVLTLAGDLALISAPGADTVYVYRHDGVGNWNAAGTLDSPGGGSDFGASLDADGNTIIVGAPGINAAYIYLDDGDALWPVSATLSFGGGFGADVALAEDTAYVSAPEVFVFQQYLGGVLEYERDNGVWTLISTRTSQDSYDGDHFGAHLAASTGLLVVVEAGIGRDEWDEINLFPRNTHWDTDQDDVLSWNDNCPSIANTDQANLDGDDDGDVCDTDIDGDGWSNDTEALAGTDPRNKDTDGDGQRDSRDPEPLVPDADRDGISDADEIAAGTDPNDPDSDGDGFDDGVDAYPLDPFDGWHGLQRVQGQSSSPAPALGSDVLLLSSGAYEPRVSGLVSVPSPQLQGEDLQVTLQHMFGSRAVLVGAVEEASKQELHAFNYDAGEWDWLGSYDTSVLLGEKAEIGNVVISGDNVAAIARVRYSDFIQDYYLMLFDITLSGVELVTSIPLDRYGQELALSEGIVFLGDRQDSGREGVVRVYDPADNFVPVEVRRPEAWRKAGDALGKGLSVTGPGEVLVESQNGGYYLNKSTGSWVLDRIRGVPTLPSTAPYTATWVGGGPARDVLIYESAETKAYNGQNLSELGVIITDDDATRPLTNGRVIVRILQDSNTLEVYHAPPPPTCSGCGC